jgi:hypothetical protein
MFFALHDVFTTKTILFVGSFTSCGYLSCATSTLGLLQGWLDIGAMVILLSRPEIGCLQINQKWN